MKMRNKLYCHHKSKLSLVARNLAFTSLGIFIFALAVSIPTYISINKGERVPTLASEEAVAEKTEVKSSDAAENNQLRSFE